MKTTLTLYLIILTAFSSSGQNNIPDSIFANNSVLEVPTIGGETGSNLIFQPDDLILYCGYDYDITQNDFHIDMIRFDQCGIVDSSFGSNGLVHHKFDQRNIGYSFELQTDGKIVCAGMQAPSNSGSQQISAVSRFLTNGDPDSSFHSTGTYALRYDGVSSGSFYSVELLPDSRIICMGNSSTNINGGVSGPGAMRFLSNGTLDTSFNVNGIARFSSATWSQFGKTNGHLLSNGKIVLTTFVMDGNFNEHFFTLQFDSTGSLDTTYGTGTYYYDATLVTSNSNICASAIDSSGSVFLAANHLGNTSIDILKLNSTGQPDNTFGVNGYVNYPLVNATVTGLELFNNGNILIKGSYSTGFGIGYGILLQPDGTTDTSFGANGLRIFDLNNNSGTHSLQDLLILPNGKWIAAGASGNFLIKKYGEENNVPHISELNGTLSTTGVGQYQWYLNGAELPFATQNTYPVIQNGTYQVLLTNAEGCTYLSDSLVIINASISESEKNLINIYPNPVSTKLFIAKNNIEPFTLVITDATGRNVVEQLINGNSDETIIPVDQLNTGIYFINIYSKTYNQKFRFIKVD